MNTITEKTKHTRTPEKPQAAPRLQEVLSIAQREQANVITRFLKSWRRVTRPHGQASLNQGKDSLFRQNTSLLSNLNSLLCRVGNISNKPCISSGLPPVTGPN